MGDPTLNRRLVLEEAQRSPDGAGGYDEAWMALGVLWAQVDAGSGRELRGGGISLSRTRYRITVRAAPYGAPSRPRPEHRFRDGARVWRILSVAESDARARFLTCIAEEEVAA